jgi:DnaJ-class molecular chaperone
VTTHTPHTPPPFVDCPRCKGEGAGPLVQGGDCGLCSGSGRLRANDERLRALWAEHQETMRDEERRAG